MNKNNSGTPICIIIWFTRLASRWQKKWEITRVWMFTNTSLMTGYLTFFGKYFLTRWEGSAFVLSDPDIIEAMGSHSKEWHCGHCTCIAGLAESCSYVAALLYWLETAVHIHEQTMSTSKANAWLPQGCVHIVIPSVKEINSQWKNHLIIVIIAQIILVPINFLE